MAKGSAHAAGGAANLRLEQHRNRKEHEDRRRDEHPRRVEQPAEPLGHRVPLRLALERIPVLRRQVRGSEKPNGGYRHGLIRLYAGGRDRSLDVLDRQQVAQIHFLSEPGGALLVIQIDVGKDGVSIVLVHHLHDIPWAVDHFDDKAFPNRDRFCKVLRGHILKRRSRRPSPALPRTPARPADQDTQQQEDASEQSLRQRNLIGG